MDASQIDHDGLFKALLREFFYEFLTLFFPKLAAATDPASLEFITTEIQVNLPDGRAQQADLVAKAKFMGSDIYFLVHVEHQSTTSREMPRRLFEYFSGFFLTHGLMIYPIVIYSHDAPETPQPSEFRMTFPDREILKFSYQVVQLNRLPWRRFLKSDNPLASALMAKMKIAERDRPRVKLECLRLMMTLKVNPARMRLIEVFVDAYLRLNRKEATRFERSIAGTDLEPREKEKIMEMVTSWMEEGLEKGLKRGLEQGLEQGRSEGKREGEIEGRRDLLLKLLHVKFGPVPESVARRIKEISSADELDLLCTRLLTAGSVEQLGLTLAC